MKNKILIVEHDREIAAAIEEVLISEDYEVAHAHAAAMDSLCQEIESADLVLLELLLPDGDGLEILRVLKVRCPALPVVMITGADDVKQAVECMKAGAEDCLRKPLAQHDLVTTVKYALSRGHMTKRASGIQPFEDEEKRIIENALEATSWCVNEAAQKLKIGRATIYRKIERYGLIRPAALPERANRAARRSQ